MATSKALNDEEVKKILRYAASTYYGERNELILQMSILSGLRVCELANLMIYDVLNTDCTIKDEVRLSAAQTKGSDARAVFLNKKLQKAIKAYLESKYSAAEITAFAYTNKANLPLFETQKSKGFTANSLAQLLFKLYKDVGIANGSSHSGRKTFITNLANKGISVHVLAKLSGHSSIATTQRYMTVNDGMCKKAVELA